MFGVLFLAQNSEHFYDKQIIAGGSGIVKKADIIILGAGCSGTSLAHYLEDSGYTGKIVLFDSRTEFNREQRWCSWAPLPASLDHLVTNSWKNWTVCDENRIFTQKSDKFSYQEIYAPHFFNYFHTRWQNSKSRIELNLGETILQVENINDFVEVTTEKETWRAKLVFDARHQDGNNFKNNKETKDIFLYQTFLGWKIEFPNPVFAKETVTLMDFRTPQNNGVNFMYVLPESERVALVESTSFSENKTEWGNHIHSVTQYIADNFGSDYRIKAEESGVLPMTTANFPTVLSERIYAIGVAGGCIRSSSGYAFHRIQRQTAKIAAAIMGNQPIPFGAAPGKYRFLDGVFLEAIARKPEIAKESFLRMFGKTAPDSLIRFLIDESAFADDLAVIAALPKIVFGKAGIQSLRRRMAGTKKKDEKRRKSSSPLPNTLGNPARRLVARRVER